MLTPLDRARRSPASRRRTPASASALFNVMRNLGGAIGIAVLQTFLTTREYFHFNTLSPSVSPFDETTRQHIDRLVLFPEPRRYGSGRRLAQGRGRHRPSHPPAGLYDGLRRRLLLDRRRPDRSPVAALLLNKTPRVFRRQRAGSSLFACISAKHFLNIASVSMTSWKPACCSLMVDTRAGGPAVLRPKPMV